MAETVIVTPEGEERRPLTAQEEQARQATVEEAAQVEAEEAAREQAVADWKQAVRDAAAANNLTKLAALLVGDDANVPVETDTRPAR